MTADSASAAEQGETAEPSTTPAANAKAPVERAGLLEWTGLALGNATVITALLVYFGWRRNETHAEGLGFEENVLDQSTQDYVLRSVGPVSTLLLIVLAVGFLGIALNRTLTPRLLEALRRARVPEPEVETATTGSDTAEDRAPTWRRALRSLRRWASQARRWTTWRRRWIPRLLLAMLASSWLILPIPALVAYFAQQELAVLVPAAIAVGALLTAKAAQIRRTLATPTDTSPPNRSTRLLMGGLLVMCVFSATDMYAESEGRRLASELPGSIPSRTEVVIYSPERLHITETGTCETPLPSDDSAYRFRYSGLRLLTRAGDRYFLISDSWTRERGTIITLQASDTYRFEFVHDIRADRPIAACPK